MSFKTVLKTREGIFAYLNDLAIGVLSTVSQDGYPHGAVLYFAVDHELNFYFITKAGSKKASFLATNHKASITTLDSELPRSVQAMGLVEEVQDAQTFEYMMERISEINKHKNSEHWPAPIARYSKDMGVTLYKLKTIWLRYGDFSEKEDVVGLSYTDHEPFTQIVPNPEIK